MEEDTPIFTPKDFLRYVASVRSISVETFKIPQRMVMVYHRGHFDFVNQLIEGEPVEWWWYSRRNGSRGVNCMRCQKNF